jgi:hypothetical protein
VALTILRLVPPEAEELDHDASSFQEGSFSEDDHADVPEEGEFRPLGRSIQIIQKEVQQTRRRRPPPGRRSVPRKRK